MRFVKSYNWKAMAKEDKATSGQSREDYIKQLITGNYSTKAPEAEAAQEPVPERTEPLGEAPPEKPREPTRRKRGGTPDYTAAFLQRKEIKTRQCVYISQQVHTVISEIVRVIADKDISVGGYIDLVLSQHLEEHKEAINELYRKDRNNLIP